MAADEREELYNFCKKLENDLAKDNIKVIGDYRENYSPGWKFNHWELKVHEKNDACMNGLLVQ